MKFSKFYFRLNILTDTFFEGLLSATFSRASKSAQTNFYIYMKLLMKPFFVHKTAFLQILKPTSHSTKKKIHVF
jgi:hypothetical protein